MDQLGRVTDVLALGANRSNTTVLGLGTSLATVAPAAEAVGQSIELTVAALGALGSAGFDASTAGTGLRSTLVRLVSFTPKAERALAGLGLATEDVNVETNGLLTVLGRLRNANIGLAEAADIFGVRQASVALALIKSSDEVRRLNFQLERAEGTTDRVAAIMDDNLNGAILRLTSRWQELNLTLASDNGVFRSATDGLASLVGGVDEGVAALGRLSDLFDEIGRQGDTFDFDFARLRQVGYGTAPRTGPAALPGGVGTGANAGFAAQARATVARRGTLAVPATAEAAPMRSADLERAIRQATDNVAIRDALSGTIRDVFTGADFTIFSDTDQQAQDQFVRGVIGPLREAFREGAEEEGPRLAANASRLIDFWVNGLQGGAETEDILKAAALRLVSNFFRQVESGEGFSPVGPAPIPRGRCGARPARRERADTRAGGRDDNPGRRERGRRHGLQRDHRGRQRRPGRSASGGRQ